jgi:hypothetical protein
VSPVPCIGLRALDGCEAHENMANLLCRHAGPANARSEPSGNAGPNPDVRHGLFVEAIEGPRRVLVAVTIRR